MSIVQNFLADGALSDLLKGVAVLGESHLIEAVSTATSEGPDIELRAAVSHLSVSTSRAVLTKRLMSSGLWRSRQLVVGRQRATSKSDQSIESGRFN